MSEDIGVAIEWPQKKLKLIIIGLVISFYRFRWSEEYSYIILIYYECNTLVVMQNCQSVYYICWKEKQSRISSTTIRETKRKLHQLIT